MKNENFNTEKACRFISGMLIVLALALAVIICLLGGQSLSSSVFYGAGVTLFAVVLVKMLNNC